MKKSSIRNFCQQYYLQNKDLGVISVSYGLPTPRFNEDVDVQYELYLRDKFNFGKAHIIIRIDYNYEGDLDLIPREVRIDNEPINTYVVREHMFQRLCNDVFFDSIPPLNRNTYRPLLGGLQVSNLDSQYVVGGYYGTLGCLALDNDFSPPAIVSLSNNHVYSHDMLIAGSRDNTSIYTDHYDDDIIQNAFSQDTPTGENVNIAPDFTATDLNGVQHSLYSDYLDQGIGVIIDFFATWCGPCWNYKQSGALEDAYQSYGPSGDNTITVLAIEASSTTDDEELYNSSFGNWTQGVTHPIINAQDNLINSYSEIVFGYPTIIYICPNGTWTYIGQPNFSEITEILQSTDCTDINFDGSKIGKFKKRWSLYPTNYPPPQLFNPCDAATSTVYNTDPSGEPLIYSGTQGSDIGQYNSWTQLNLFDGDENDINFTVNESPLKWAVTFELDNMFTIGLDGSVTLDTKLYTTGARMGPWGVSNVHNNFGDSILVPIELFATITIPFQSQGAPSLCAIDNCIVFKATDDHENFLNTCIPATLGGNSGSAIVAELNGEFKIVGLLFAGEQNGAYGIFCRIDEIANALNLSAFTSETTEFMISNVNQTEIIDLPEPFSDLQYLEVDGKKYWQTGIVQY